MLDFRAEAVLAVLVTSELALPPTPIYENLRLNGETFSKRTVHRKLRLLVEEGYVEKVVDEKGYYRATERGRAHVEGERERVVGKPASVYAGK
jgi:Fe2+ or Zn2+ uptake regulation protein